MARRLFFVDEVRNGRAEIAGDEALHLTKVLRVEAGQRYELSDNESLYLGEVEVARKQQVVFRVLEKHDAVRPAVHSHLAAALIKFDHFEWILEKATELGVERITPVITVRMDKGLDHGAQKRTERWLRILKESCQQSRRAHLPALNEPVRLTDLLRTENGLRLFLDEEASAEPILQALPEQRTANDAVTLLAGPEGGWTEEERAAAGEHGWKRVSLGPAILRAETAALAALAVVAAAWDSTRARVPSTEQ